MFGFKSTWPQYTGFGGLTPAQDTGIWTTDWKLELAFGFEWWQTSSKRWLSLQGLNSTAEAFSRKRAHGNGWVPVAHIFRQEQRTRLMPNATFKTTPRMSKMSRYLQRCMRAMVPVLTRNRPAWETIPLAPVRYWRVTLRILTPCSSFHTAFHQNS